MPFHPRGQGLAAALITLALLSLTLLTAPVAAQTPCDDHAGRLADIHTREQLKAYVHCAAEHIEAVGHEQAFQDFSGGAWHDGPMALFAATIDGEHLFAYGVDIPPGSDLSEWRDSEGTPIVQQQARIARDFGAGFVYYRIENIASGLEEPKESYVLRLDYQGVPAFIGAGLHAQDTRATCSPEVVRASLVYSERDVEAFVTCAAHYLQQNGLQALHDFNSDPRWIAGPTYLILLDMESLVAVVAAGQPHLVGVDGSEFRDMDDVQFAREKQRILATHDDGYVYYRFRNPASGEVEPKATYLRRVLIDGHAYILGAGLYVPAAGCRSLPLAREIVTRDELQLFVRCAARLVEERGELAWDLFLNHPQWIGGATYIFVLDELCRQLVYPLDYERAEGDEPRCDLRDAEGTPLNQNVLDTVRSEAGEGWVEYVWLNPANDKVEAKHAFVVGETLDGEHVSIGAGLYESQLQG
ncbi:MAG: cache domain-containing protein [Anaerolineaceae bacterium]|nr:cache domain-containing protein [Anaerolineaceae bacterium]